MYLFSHVFFTKKTTRKKQSGISRQPGYSKIISQQEIIDNKVKGLAFININKPNTGTGTTGVRRSLKVL
jgi:hypothetical protein